MSPYEDVEMSSRVRPRLPGLTCRPRSASGLSSQDRSRSSPPVSARSCSMMSVAIAILLDALARPSVVLRFLEQDKDTPARGRRSSDVLFLFRQLLAVR